MNRFYRGIIITHKKWALQKWVTVPTIAFFQCSVTVFRQANTYTLRTTESVIQNREYFRFDSKNLIEYT